VDLTSRSSHKAYGFYSYLTQIENENMQLGSKGQQVNSERNSRESQLSALKGTLFEEEGKDLPAFEVVKNCHLGPISYPDS